MKRLLAAALLSAAAANAAGTVTVVTRDADGKPVPDAVAYLTPADVPVAVAPPAQPVAIVQRDQEFSPYVTPVVVGTRVVFPNEDTVRHHVYSVSPAKRFEIPLYIGDSKEAIVFDKEGIVALGCNIHDWMVAYVVVLSTPYFAKTGSEGRAEVAALPPGRYRLKVWHPRAGTVERDVSVAEAADTTQIISVTLRPDHRIRRAPDAGAGGYK
jgi:plastocyanin